MTAESDDKYRLALATARASDADLYEVKRLLNEAHEAGDQRATYAIATWYLNGNEITALDEVAGIDMLLTLTDSNIAEALFDLAFAYDNGRGGLEDELKAFTFYMKAALLGDKESCDQVSQFYREGKSVPFNEALADAWQKRATYSEEDISPPYRVCLG